MKNFRRFLILCGVVDPSIFFRRADGVPENDMTKIVRRSRETAAVYKEVRSKILKTAKWGGQRF